MRRALVLALVLSVTGCAGDGGGDEPGATAATRPAPPVTTSPPSATSTAPEATTGTTATAGQDEGQTVSVYFLRKGEIAVARRTIAPTRAVAQAAVDALSRGPTPLERQAGFMTRIDPYMIVGSLVVTGGTATIRLQPCPPMEQIVFTLTQFPAVKRVRSPCLRGDEAVTRADLERVMPAILVESPTIGETVSSPLRVRGSANTFEATFVVELVDAGGRAVKQQGVTATSGSGTRGTFRATVPFRVDRPGGKLVVYEESAKDGSRVNTVEIPLRLQPEEG